MLGSHLQKWNAKQNDAVSFRGCRKHQQLPLFFAKHPALSLTTPPKFSHFSIAALLNLPSACYESFIWTITA